MGVFGYFILAYQRKSTITPTDDNSRGVHGEVTYTWHLTNIMENVQRGAVIKHQDPSPYINSIENLYDTIFVYIQGDPIFLEDMQKYHFLLEKEFKSLPAVSRGEWSEKIYPLKCASFLYKALLCALKRQDMLPRRREVIEI